MRTLSSLVSKFLLLFLIASGFSLFVGDTSSRAEVPVQIAANFDPAVAEVQRKLIALGYDAGFSDGIDGARTRDAIKAFQKDHALPPTGRLGEKGKTILKEIYEVSFGGPNGGAQQSKLESKTKSTEIPIAPAEKILRRLGYLSDIDDDLSSSVMKFQSDTALAKTGRIDSATYERLLESEEYLFNEFLPYWKRQASQIRRARNVQKHIASNPALLMSLLEQEISQNISELQAAEVAIKQLLRSSVPIIGCYDTPKTVLGFYNVVQNLWIIVWLDQENRAIAVAILEDLNEESSKKDLSWIHYYASGNSISKSLKLSFDRQLESFQKLFNEKTCSGDSEGYVKKKLELADGKILTEKNAVSSEIDGDLLAQIRKKTKENEEVEDIHGLTLMAALIGPSEKDYDILTFHTLEIDQTLIIVQGWKIDDGSPEQLARAGVDLLPYEDRDENLTPDQ